MNVTWSCKSREEEVKKKRRHQLLDEKKRYSRWETNKTPYQIFSKAQSCRKYKKQGDESSNMH